MNVLKSTSCSYVQNMIENMVLTSYLDKSYFVASWGGYVASIQMMSRDKLKHQIRRQFLSHDKFILYRDIAFMWHRWLRFTMTAKQVNAAIDVFLVWRIVTCYITFSASVGYIIKHFFHENLCPITFWTKKWRHNHYQLVHRATRLRLVALYKSLTMIVT